MVVIKNAALEIGPIAPLEVLAQVRKLGVATGADAASIARRDRDRPKIINSSAVAALAGEPEAEDRALA